MLIPVTVRPGPDPQVAAFRDGDHWLRAPLEGAPSATAASLVDQLPTQIRFVLAVRGVLPEAVAFKESPDGSQLTLIFSIPVPMPFADPDLKDERWIDLVEPSTRYTEARQRGSDAVADVPRAGTILEWWAERLEEQSALIAFLPRYFTARQARDVYSAFWGYDQDADKFAAWSGIGANKPHGALSKYVEASTVSDDGLVGEFASAIKEAHVKTTSSRLDDSVVFRLALRASDGTVGLDPTFDGADGDANVRRALTAASALVAYQRRAPGPKPSWFRRVDGPIQHREKLTRLWATRPSWIYPPGKS
jgi:hypothetical protein